MSRRPPITRECGKCGREFVHGKVGRPPKKCPLCRPPVPSREAAGNSLGAIVGASEGKQVDPDWLADYRKVVSG